MWKQVWDKRGKIAIDPSRDLLDQLLYIDGFDTGMGKLSRDDWIEYVRVVSEKVDLNVNDLVLEVGCGSGAFLHALPVRPRSITGIDNSKSLASIARKHLGKEHEIIVREANCLRDTFPIDHLFDKIFSNSVFQYFPSEKYAESVIIQMGEKIRKGGHIILLDLPDIVKKQAYIEEKKRNLGDERYDVLYKNLPQTFYSRVHIQGLLKTNGFDIVEISDQSINNYGNNKYRFNVLARRS